MSTANTKKTSFNLYWLASTGLGVWFLAVHAPPILKERKVWTDFPFLLHLFGVYGVYIACMHNALWTPSCVSVWSLLQKSSWQTDVTDSSQTRSDSQTITTARHAHVWVGRCGLIMGVLGFVVGVYLVMSRSLQDDPTFAIAITIGGIFQMQFQYKGYTSIRRYKELREQLDSNEYLLLREDERLSLLTQKEDALKSHISNMLGLFVMGCGIPAIIRAVAPGEEGNPVLLPILIAVGAMNLLVALYVKSFGQTPETRPPEASPLL